MDCRTCGDSMYHLDSTHYWCGRCGTRMDGGGLYHEFRTPELVELCRKFRASMDDGSALARVWGAFGIADAIGGGK